MLISDKRKVSETNRLAGDIPFNCLGDIFIRNLDIESDHEMYAVMGCACKIFSFFLSRNIILVVKGGYINCKSKVLDFKG